MNILRVDLSEREVNKGIVLEVTDPYLLLKDRRDHPGDQREPDHPERQDHRRCDACVCAGCEKRLRDFYRNMLEHVES